VKLLPPASILNPTTRPLGEKLLQQFESIASQGITLTAPGFYSPQGRQVRAKSATSNLLSILSSSKVPMVRESQTWKWKLAGIYGLAACLGHQALSCNVILANRLNKSV